MAGDRQDQNRTPSDKTRTGSGPDITDNANAGMAPKGLDKPGEPDSRREGDAGGAPVGRPSAE